MEATRGQREVFGLYRDSMHEAGEDGRSPFQVAKAAAEDRGEHIFAKPDHLGIQVLIGAKTGDIVRVCQSWLTQDCLWLSVVAMQMRLHVCRPSARRL